MITIALDAMGGDHGVSVVVPAALQTLALYSDLQLILVGDEERIRSALQNQNIDRLIIQHASQQVEMDEAPSHALRMKKDSSMRVAINLVKEGTAQACVSAGNTGALMATSRFVLKTLPQIDRPAIVGNLPTVNPDKKVRVLDLGANVDSPAAQLFQFAVMGSVLASAVDNISRPTVGLLNIGEEDIKGNDQVKETARLLSENSSINYIGYIEGDAVYKGVADVVVCDGFVGNVMIKSSEGIARMIGQYVKDAFRSSWWTKLCGLAAMLVMKKVAQRIDPAKYNGASLIGLQGIVIKSHGSAQVPAYVNAIEEAIVEVKKEVPRRIADEVSNLLKTSENL